MTSFQNPHKGLHLVMVAIGVAYPFLVYFGLRQFGSIVVGALLIGLLIARLFLVRAAGKPRHEYVILLASLVLVAAILPVDGTLALMIYPLTISFGLAAAFAISLLRPPNVIETFARLMTPDLSAAAIAYTRKVTLVWVVFLVANGLVSAATALSGDMEIWVLYNGFISYLLVGALLAGEFVVRQFVKQSHGTAR